MSLIKCVECGREISDKARQCIYCGCPVENVICCEECGNVITNNDNICRNCGCPVNVDKSEVVNNCLTNNNNNNNFEEEFSICEIDIDFEMIDKIKNIFYILGILFILPGIFNPILFIFSPFTIIFIFIYHYIKDCKINSITLTNKRIKGVYRKFFFKTTIDVSLDKIDSICTYSGFLKINSIEILSGNRRSSITFVKNGDKFCNSVLEQMEKYKIYMFNRKI